MRISDWSSDVCSSDLRLRAGPIAVSGAAGGRRRQAVERTSNAASPASGRPETSTEVTSDRKSVVEGKSVSIRVDLGGRRNIKTKNKLLINKSKKIIIQERRDTKTNKITKQ